MNAVLKFFLGLMIVAALGAAAMTVAQMPGSAPAARAKLQKKADQAVASQRADWAAVTMDGQKAIITGTAPDADAREVLIAKIAAAEGAGGLVSGGVTAVDAVRLKVTPPMPVAAPFVFIAERESGVLSFSGHVPDQATRDAIYRLAANLFPDDEISGELEIAGGAPASAADWLIATSASLRSLSHLRNGVAQANDYEFTLTGEAEDETRAAAARTLLSDLPDGLRGTAAIAIRKPPTSIEDIIIQAEEETSEDNADALAQTPGRVIEENDATEAAEDAVAQKDECLERLEAAINARRIGFTSARADIDNPSRDQLRRVAGILNECPSARLSVTGHTDSSGNAARNRQLSGYRADAVRAFLISVGAPAERISSRGAGSSEPVASNSTPAGRERNRRIEIDVTSSN